MLEELFRVAHNLKGSSAVAGLEKFATFVHRIEDGIVLLRDGKAVVNDGVVSMLLEAQKRLSDWIIATRENAAVEFDTTDFLGRYQASFTGGQVAEAKADNSVPSESHHEEESENAGMQTAGAHSATEVAGKSVPSSTGGGSKVAPGKSASKGPGSGETVRISAQKLDQLLQTIGELSIHQSIIWHMKGELKSTNKLFLNSAQLAQKLTKEIYDKALALRMQPLTNVFQRLERAIHDLSRSLGKDVRIVVAGSEVELDKAVVEKILDPLTHIVRNAIDHGVEQAAARVAAGKNPQGTIEITARQDAFGVELIVKDDGKGLSTEKLKKKALEKGLIHASREYSRAEILDFIFLPGFSTAEKVTDVSGRGVGMDVVRRTLEDLRGNIEIDSTEGVGTRFAITLPTSVSIIDAMLIKLAGQNYVVPIDAVDEVITLEDDSALVNAAMMPHNGYILPLTDMQRLLAKRSTKMNGDDGKRRAVMVCKYGQKRIGVLIDRVIGQQQVVVRSFSENISGTFGFLGGTILGNGEPGLIIDMSTLVNQFAKEIGRDNGSGTEVAA